MTQQEIDKIQQEIANKTPGELMAEARARNAMKERVKRLKKLRKWK